MLPLKNKTVLITRSANQTKDFIKKLNQFGANTISLPLIENKAINQNELIKKVNQNNYDWIIFTSVNAVSFFFETVLPESITAKFAVVGSKTKEVLLKYNKEVDFTPSEFTAKHLANEIPIKSNQRILIPRSNLAKNNIIEVLEKRGCNVEAISIYENNSIDYSKEELNKIFNQQIDFITFTSGSIVLSFKKLGIPLKNEKVICIGPETAKMATDNNIIVTSIANPHTIDGMIKTIISTK
jgi:uroporphyrinogen-III synthase